MGGKNKMNVTQIDPDRLIHGLARIVNRRNDAYIKRALAPKRGGFYDTAAHEQYMIYEGALEILFDALPYEVRSDINRYISRQR